MSEYENPIHAMADHLIDFFEGEEAVNYIEQTFGCNDDPSKSFVITMQKVEGLTPCQKLDQANKRIEELEKQVDNAHNALCAVKDSGAVREDDVIEMIDRGLDNKEQK